MATTIEGHEALAQLDSLIAARRQRLNDLLTSVEENRARAAHLHKEQVDRYRQLAEIRLDILDDEDQVGALQQLHNAARDLLDEHEVAIAREEAALAELGAQINALEEARAALAAEHREVLKRYEDAVLDVKEALSATPDYQALADAHEQAAAIAERARQKLAVAEQDREEKGAPYREDPLFSYLWRRRYRTPDYEGGPLTRFFDGWVARLCKYDQAYANYGRLTELPVRLGEHVARVEAKASAAEEALEAAETEALTQAGADTLRAEAETLYAKILATDEQIDTAEQAHLDQAAHHQKMLTAQAGPVVDARRLLEEGLQRASFPELRILASETIQLDDDSLVDELVDFRAQQLHLEEEVRDLQRLPDRHRRSLATLEALRRQFKAARFDSPYIEFKSVSFDDIVDDTDRGETDADTAFQRLRKIARKSRAARNTGFGGRRQGRSMGVPDLMGDILWEVARHAGRRGGLGGVLGPRPTYRRPSAPRPSPRPKSRGGFRTGGGF